MTTFDEYFYPIFGAGLVVAFFTSLAAGLIRGIVIPGFLLVVGVLAFWGCLFIGSDIGYREWQSIPNPPDEAYADTMPLGALLAGWVPGVCFCGLVFAACKLCKFLLNRGNKQGIEERMPTHHKDSGNPFQPPDR